jgi:hypothetical protein
MAREPASSQARGHFSAGTPWQVAWGQRLHTKITDFEMTLRVAGSLTTGTVRAYDLIRMM